VHPVDTQPVGISKLVAEGVSPRTGSWIKRYGIERGKRIFTSIKGWTRRLIRSDRGLKLRDGVFFGDIHSVVQETVVTRDTSIGRLQPYPKAHGLACGQMTIIWSFDNEGFDGMKRYILPTEIAISRVVKSPP
jgi:hypothetical protein